MITIRRDAVAACALFAELLASGRHADAQTRLLAMIVAKKGSTLTTPVQGRGA